MREGCAMYRTHTPNTRLALPERNASRCTSVRPSASWPARHFAGATALDAMGATFTEINAIIDEAFPGRDMARMAKGLRRLIERMEEKTE